MKSIKIKIFTGVLTLVALFGMVAVVPTMTHPAFATSKSEAQQGIKDTGAGGSASDVPKLIKGALSLLSYLVGVASIIMIVIGGFKYVTSNGDSGGIASAKNTIIYAVVGLVIAIFAQGIVRFVIDKVT
jgi:Type IV secretion system pilin